MNRWAPEATFTGSVDGREQGGRVDSASMGSMRGPRGKAAK